VCIMSQMMHGCTFATSCLLLSLYVTYSFHCCPLSSQPFTIRISSSWTYLQKNTLAAGSLATFTSLLDKKVVERHQKACFALTSLWGIMLGLEIGSTWADACMARNHGVPERRNMADYLFQIEPPQEAGMTLRDLSLRSDMVVKI